MQNSPPPPNAEFRPAAIESPTTTLPRTAARCHKSKLTRSATPSPRLRVEGRSPCGQADSQTDRHRFSDRVVSSGLPSITFADAVSDLLFEAGLDLSKAESLAEKIDEMREQARLEYLTKSDLMIRWQCSERTVRRWVSSLGIPQFSVAEWEGGRVVRYRAKDIVEAEKRHMSTPVHVQHV